MVQICVGIGTLADEYRFGGNVHDHAPHANYTSIYSSATVPIPTDIYTIKTILHALLN